MDRAASELEPTQRQRALQRANRVRSARAYIKRRIAAGELTAADAVLGHRWEIERMGIAELLISQRGWGRQRCRRFLTALAMSEIKTIGSMTERQRTATGAQLTGGQPARRTRSTLDDTTRPAPARHRGRGGLALRPG
jgi:hypothetical protein